jgi:hypothetical protein
MILNRVLLASALVLFVSPAIADENSRGRCERSCETELGGRHMTERDFDEVRAICGARCADEAQD